MPAYDNERGAVQSESMSAGTVIVFLVALVGVWSLMGYWGGTIGRRKGYDFWVGFLAGFFGGLIGILIMYVINPRRAPQPPPYYQESIVSQGVAGELAPQRTAACQRCANLVEKGSVFCPYCGEKLQAPPPPHAPQ